jgi:hypothetical protein
MKPILFVSIALNVILLTFGGVILQRRQVGQSAAPVSHFETHVIAEPQAKPQVVAGAAPEPFRWSRMESSDDATYIHNLRDVGCPEGTIRDILGAAIGRRYDQKRAALTAQLQKGESGAVEVQDAKAKLWDEQNDLMARLFNLQNSFGADGFIAHLPPGTTPQQATERHLRAIQGISSDSAPLAFLEPDESFGLSEVQVEAWNQVYERFAATVGDGGNPKDPAYRERWQEAQVKADGELKALFGATKVIQWQAKIRSQMPPKPGE